MQPLPISLCMIVKNEEKPLPACLESVQGLVNEMIIVDTGSSDRTVEIAKTYGAKIYHFDWIDDFSAARNYSLEHATNPWVLQLDADEELISNSLSWFYDSYPWIDKWGYLINIQNLSDLKTNDLQFTHNLVRFFRNTTQIRYRNRIHEVIYVANEKLGKSNAKILHKGYAHRNPSHFRNKQNEKLLFAELENEPNNGAYYGYLAQHYSAVNQLDKAYHYAEIAIEKGVRISLLLFSVNRIRFTYAYNKHDSDLLKNLYHSTSEEVYPTKHFYMGLEYFRMGDSYNQQAKEEFKTFITVIETHKQRKLVLNSFIGMAYQRLGIITQNNGNYSQAIALYHTALEQSPSMYQNYALLGKAFVQTGETEMAKKCFIYLTYQLQTHKPKNYQTLIKRYQSVIKSL